MKDPAMLFYTSDFLTGVALLSMAERGQYITLLCLQQQHGHMTAREMKAAVGKVSPAVMEKFQRDAEGKFFNRRAELEIQKREKHAAAQRENVLKRWAKEKEEKPSENDHHGISGGITVVNTTVIPLENENGNRNNLKPNQREEILPARAREEPGKNDPELARFMAALMDQLGPISSTAAQEALAWYKDMGGELCLHAVELALDNGKRSWSYVRAILGRWEKEGVKTLAAAQAEEKVREAKKQKTMDGGNAGPVDLSDVKSLLKGKGTKRWKPGEVDKHLAEMDKLMETMPARP